MSKYKQKVYFLKEIMDTGVLKQLKRANNQFNNNLINKKYISLYQGQIINYIHFDVSAKTFVSRLALCLEDSDNYIGEVVICPLIEATTNKDLKIGIDIGKIIGSKSHLDYIAVIPGIHSVSKECLLINDKYSNNAIPQSKINLIINAYCNFLKNLITNNTKIIEANMS